MIRKNSIKWIIFAAVSFILFLTYWYFDPYKNNFFPDCIFHHLTGYKCPLCGSQRSLHYLFNFEIVNAFKENILLIISIPYILLRFYFYLFKPKTYNKLRIFGLFFSKFSIYIVLIIIIVFGIVRNIPFQ
jgi:hypothetical protein